MSLFPRLNFPACRFRTKREGVRTLVWDALRGQWLVLTPEEWVRQHLVRFLASREGIDPKHMAQEYPVGIGVLNQRADVVCFDRERRPLLLAECKAPDVAIDDAVLSQAVRYNSVVEARYVMVTNGIVHRIYERISEGGYVPLSEFPSEIGG